MAYGNLLKLGGIIYPSPIYPIDLDSNYTLFEVYNSSQSILAENVSSQDISISVVPKKANEQEVWPENGFITINSELIYYDKVEKNESGKIFKFLKCSRGIEKKSKDHNKGDPIYGMVVAQHHDQLADAIIELERTVGYLEEAAKFSNLQEARAMQTMHLDSRRPLLSMQAALSSMAAAPPISDDACPDVEFIVNILEVNPNTQIEFCVRIFGNYNSYRLDFGDGNFTTTEFSGTYTYSGGTVDPKVTVNSDNCCIVQQPTTSAETIIVPELLTPSVPFVVTIPECPDFPSFVAPSSTRSCPGSIYNLPPIIIPGLVCDTSTTSEISISQTEDLCSIIVSIVGCCLPSEISVVDCCNFPSKISFDCCAFPSMISVESCNLPSRISIDCCDIPSSISLNCCDLPSFISLDCCELPTSISLDCCELPSSISIDCCDLPSIISIDCCDLPSEISIVGCCDFPSEIQVIASEIPSEIILIDNLPSEIILVDNLPSEISFGDPPSFAPIEFADPPSFSDICFCDPPSFDPISFDNTPSFAPIEFADPPSFSDICFCDPPSFSPISFDNPPTISVDWGTPPTISCNCTVSVVCPSSTSSSGMAFNARQNFMLDDEDKIEETTIGTDWEPIQIDQDDLGIPSEILVKCPKIPPIKLIHDIPTSIDLKFKNIPDIKLVADDSIPTNIKLDGSSVPNTIFIDASEVPRSVKIDASDMPKAVYLEPAESLPSVFKLEAVGIPDKLEVIGIPDSIEVKGFPDYIQLKMPDDPTVKLVYEGPKELKLDIGETLSNIIMANANS